MKMKIKMIIKMKMKMINDNDNDNENRVVQILRLLGNFKCKKLKQKHLS